jgi:hypothetical protein
MNRARLSSATAAHAAAIGPGGNRTAFTAAAADVMAYSIGIP